MSRDGLRVLLLAWAVLPLAGCVTGGDATPSLTVAANPAGDAPAAAVPVGGLVGGTLGTGLGEADRRRAYDAEITALDGGGPGAPIGWRGENGAHGTVIAGPAYARSGYQTCRDYSHTVYVQNKPQIARGVACRNDEGRWISMS